MITAGLMLLSAVAAWVAKELLIDRRDRDTITADRDAARAEVARLSTQHASDVADLAKSDGLLTSAVFRAECAETTAAAFEVALGFATLRADGVASLDAARLARGRA